MRGVALAIVDPDPFHGEDMESSRYSYMHSCWLDPDEPTDLLDTEVATLLVSFDGSNMRSVPLTYARSIVYSSHGFIDHEGAC